MDLLKLVALDGYDMDVVSTHLQDATVKTCDIRWRPAEKRVVVGLDRFRLGGGERRTAGVPPPPRGVTV